jgi:hypothetical protein
MCGPEFQQKAPAVHHRQRVRRAASHTPQNPVTTAGTQPNEAADCSDAGISMGMLRCKWYLDLQNTV